MKATRQTLLSLRLPFVALVLLLAGCGPSSVWVTRGPQPKKGAKAVRVGYPPPPARVEYIPLQRRPECRYQDGYYISQGGAWVWRPGRWVVESEECYYAPPETKYEKTPQGQLLMHRAPGYYQKKEPHKACKVPPSCDAETETLEVKR